MKRNILIFTKILSKMNSPRTLFSETITTFKNNEAKIVELDQVIAKKQLQYDKIYEKIEELSDIKNKLKNDDIVVFKKEINLSINVTAKEITNYKSVSSNIYHRRSDYEYANYNESVIVHEAVLYFTKNSTTKKFYDKSNFLIALICKDKNTIFRQFLLNTDFSFQRCDLYQDERAFSKVILGIEKIKKDKDLLKCINFLNKKLL